MKTKIFNRQELLDNCHQLFTKSKAQSTHFFKANSCYNSKIVNDFGVSELIFSKQWFSGEYGDNN